MLKMGGNFKDKGSENHMCKKIKELNGKSADDILNENWERKKIPIDISQILSKLGIRVLEYDFGSYEKEEGIKLGNILGAVVPQNDDLVVLYKKGDGLNRARFTLAHEMGHCCREHITPNSGQYIELFRSEEQKYDEKEYDANVFAGELLIPTYELSLFLSKYYKDTFPSLTTLSKAFAVSHHVMSERLKYLRVPFYDENKGSIIIQGETANERHTR